MNDLPQPPWLQDRMQQIYERLDRLNRLHRSGKITHKRYSSMISSIRLAESTLNQQADIWRDENHPGWRAVSTTWSI